MLPDSLPPTTSRVHRAIPRHTGAQHGMALAMSLIFLLILTLLAVVSMNTGSMQEKMAGNMRDLDISLQSAESATFTGRGDLSVRGSLGSFPPCQGNVNGIWCVGTVDWKLPSWWIANGVEYGGGGKQITEAYEDPRYALEELGFYASVEGSYSVVEGTGGGRQGAEYHRIHARGVGATGVAESVLHGVTKKSTTR